MKARPTLQFMLKLSLALGQPLSEIRCMTSKDLALYMAFDRISPIGAERLDAGLAIQTSVLANAHRPKGANAYKPQDFMPWLPKKQQTQDEMMAILLHASRASNGNDQSTSH